MGYTKNAIQGLSWITLLRVVTRIITFCRLAILGRLLTPTQFGFFGIASLVLSFLDILTDTGINIFLVQEKSDIKQYLNSAWVISIARGIILALSIVLITPFVVTFFNSPEAYTVVLLMALVPFIRGFINPMLITYQKNLQFQKEFLLRTILFFIDVIISILFGILTRNAVSFVYGLIASALVEVFLSFILIPVYPKLKIEYQKIRHIFRKGWWITITGIFSYFAENGDNIAVGKLLGSASLGMYQVAYKFSTLPISEVTNVVNQTVFPVYTKFSDDKKRLAKAFGKVLLLSSLAAFLLGGAIFLFAKPIILIFMGDQWLAAIPVIQILALYGILRTIFGNFAPVFLSVGKQDYVAQMTFFRVVGLGIVIIPFVMWYGMIGAGYAMLLSICIEIPVILYFTYKIFRKK